MIMVTVFKLLISLMFDIITLGLELIAPLQTSDK